MSDLAQVSVEQRGNVTLARVSGEVDMSNTAALDRHMHLADGDGALVLDLSEVVYLDSAGLALVDDLARTCRSQGRPLRLVADEASIARRTIALAGLDAGLTIDDELDQALSAAAG